MPPEYSTHPADARHHSLDGLRGLAILGILVMNIQGFAMPWPAYSNPEAYGDLGGLNAWVFRLGYLFFDTKFYSLFALMFGAGMVLLLERTQEAGAIPSVRHYRRMLVLAVIGLAHGTLLWYGDILLMYAVCGSVAWLGRHRRPLTLLLWGVALMAVPPAINVWTHAQVSGWSPENLAVLAKSWQPGSAVIARELAVYSGGYLQQLPYRSDIFLTSVAWSLGLKIFWQTTGLMLTGMALYRWRILTAGRSTTFYRRLLFIGAAIGLGLASWALIASEARDWAFPWSKFIGPQINEAGAPLLALAWMSLVMLAYRSGHLPRTRRALETVGRTALSNYLLQSLLCTTIFYGHGLGLFGDLSRAQQMLVVLLVWTIQIPLSQWWLSRFRQGPVEWIWRCFARWEWTPMRR